MRMFLSMQISSWMTLGLQVGRCFDYALWERNSRQGYLYSLVPEPSDTSSLIDS